MEYDFISGSKLLIDKPVNWTSFDVVNKIRYQLKRALHLKKIKVGHAGTLDPLATGLLIICTGKLTKQINQFQAEAKEYEGIIRLGATTPSYDLETEIDQIYNTDGITNEKIKRKTKDFIGTIEQIPPIFSALRVDGQRAYKLARKGIEAKIEKRKVHISSFDISKIDGVDVHFKINCSKGTYIRSIANDFGKALNNGAHLASLRRTKIGDHHIKDAHSITDLIDLISSINTKKEGS